MLSKKEQNQRIALRTIGHPSVVVPGAIGLTGLILSLGIGAGGLAIFGSIVVCLIAAGVLSWRFLFKLNKITKDTLEDMQREVEQAHEARLNALRDKLASDHEPRDEELLDALRDIEDAFKKDRTWVGLVDRVTAMTAMRRFDEIFEASIAMLERSFDQRKTAQAIRGEGRQRLEAASSRILDKVQTGIDQLGLLLAKAHEIGATRFAGQDLSEHDHDRSLQEFQDLLAVAESVEADRQAEQQDDDDRYGEYLES